MGEAMTDQDKHITLGQITLGWSPTGYAAAAIVTGVILFLAVNVFASVAFRSARLDLTQQHLYTLSEGTIGTLAALEEPITLRFYFSESLVSDSQFLTTYGARVRNLLEEYVAHAGGNLILEVIDPEPFTEREDEAVALGLARAQVGGDQIFFGLVGTNSIDGQEIVPFFVPSREEFLEYDLTQIVSRLNQTHRPVLGIITNLSLDTGPVGLGAIEQGARAQPYYVYEQLLLAFELEFLEQEIETVPDEIDVLMIAHPRDLSDATLYAIDQFVLGGGRILLFVDPYSEVSMQAGPDGQPMRGATESSQFERLMTSWGVTMDSDLVIADRGAGEQVPANFDPRRGVITYVAWLALGPEHMNPSELVTEPLQRGLNLGTVGALVQIEDATTEMSPMVLSSDDAMLIPVDEVRYGPDMDRLLREFVPSGQSYTIAARITGAVASAFPDGPPASEVDDAGNENSIISALPANHLAEGSINVIVMTDTDIFDDAFYVAAVDFGSGAQRVPTKDNDAFVLNAVDFLMGSNDLLSLRARAVSDRPFLVVEDLRRRAEERFLAAEEQLQTRLSEVEARLRELRGQTRGLGSDVRPELDERRREELLRFQDEQQLTRTQLREVQRSLRAEIEQLGTWVKAINIVLMPILIALLALGLVVVHRTARARRLRRVAS